MNQIGKIEISVVVMYFNPHLPNGLSHPYQLDESIIHLRGVWYTYFICIIFFIEISIEQCRPWSDAAFCGVWSGSALFAYVPNIGCQAYVGYCNDPKFSDKYAWANSADPDQQSDQVLHCLPFHLHRLDSLVCGKVT